MSWELEQSLAQIEADRAQGASQITRGALATLGMAAVYSQAQTPAALVRDLKVTALSLMQARPSMASIANYLCLLLNDVARHSAGGEEVRDVVRFVCRRAGELSRELEAAQDRVAEAAAQVVGDGEVVLTCSYSSTVCRSLEQAWAGGKRFRVVVARSCSPDGLCHGEATAEHLRLAGIPVQVVSDRGVRREMKGATRALVGADAVLADGSVVNGLPTHKVALAARAAGAPFFSVCETAKFNVLSFLGGQVVIGEGFEVTRPHLVSGVVTERGLMRSREIGQRMQEMAIYVRPFFL